MPQTAADAHKSRARPERAEDAGLFRLLVERIVDYAVFLLTTDGYIWSWNAGAERLKGYQADEIVGQHFERLYTDEDRAAGRPRQLLAAAREDGRVEDEGWRVRKDGSCFWADVIITALYDQDGLLRGFAKITRDLTQRRAGDEELRQSEQRFRILVDSVKDYAIFMLSTDGTVLSWNQGAQRLKGYTPQEIIGQSFELFYPDARAAERPRATVGTGQARRPRGGRGLAGSQGRLAILGRCRHHVVVGCTPSVDRDSPRSPET